MEPYLAIFRALADPTRLRITLLVLEMELAVGELADILAQSQPRISRHLRILDEVGLVERRKEGSWVFLRPGPAILDPTLSALLRIDGLNRSAQAQADRERLNDVRAGRAARAEAYFSEHAQEWDAIRSLHIAEAEVESAMQQLLAPFPLGHLVDIGTGTGRMIELFCAQAERVTGIDKSPEMLRLTRAKLSNGAANDDGSSPVELTQGDFNELPLPDACANSAILHQVLHYAQHPERVLHEVGRVLNDGGIILVADFAAHDREELRSDHAHARLGFADLAIAGWFADAAIDIKDIVTLDGGPLTVKLWLGRKSGPVALDPGAARDSASNKRPNQERPAA